MKKVKHLNSEYLFTPESMRAIQPHKADGANITLPLMEYSEDKEEAGDA